MEIEAKLGVTDRATFDRLRRLEELAGYRLEPAGVNRIHDRYLDTDDRAIFRAGYACRVRRKSLGPEFAKGETFIATLKGLGGSDAVSGIHQRAEYEVWIEADDPATWPESPARDLALQLSGGRPLHELFSLDQERHQHLLYVDAVEGARCVAELSLDMVTPVNLAEANPRPYWELEIELLDQGGESDLQTLVSYLKTTWGLQPEPRSKFERGLALVDEVTKGDRRTDLMEETLTPQERARLQSWTEIGNRPVQRRARIVLLHIGGESTDTIAGKVGLSPRQVRRWLAAFRDERMHAFPSSLQEERPAKGSAVDQDESLATAEPVTVTTTSNVEPAEAVPPAPLAAEELWARSGVDMDRANFVKKLALQLFDITADVHNLSPNRRTLLGVAATLHDIGSIQNRDQRHLVGRDLILAQPIVGFDRAEQDMLASVVAFHRKKVRRKSKDAFMRLPTSLQQETLALAALLRLAAGLDASGSQSTIVSRFEAHDKSLTLVCEGPMAEKDVTIAQRRADLWNELFAVRLNVVTERQMAQISLIFELGAGIASLPELSAPGLLPDDPMSEAGRKTLWFHFLRMLKHERGTVLGEDIEELHDMRVASRRMRAAFRVFGDFFEPKALAPFLKGVRRVTRALGPVRDLDVFEEKAGRYLTTLPEEDRGCLDPLIETWHGEREDAREKMLAFLDSDRYREFKRDFAEFLQAEGSGVQPIPQGLPVAYQVRHVAPRLIYARYETVRVYETVLAAAQIETLHALRIDCKYLRYTLEFLREVLGPEGEAVINEVKGMQDHLGDLNDAEVAIGRLSDFLRDWDSTQVHVPLGQRRSVEGVVTYLASRYAEKHRLLVTFPEAWDRINREEVRRWLALAVAAL